jgi:glutathione S-transferase/3-isopropylmalate dehydratase
MLKIYHTPPTRSIRIVWLCEEMGLPYEAVTVAFGGKPSDELAAISPLGQLPAIEDGDVRMIESIAIMQYLMARHGPTKLAVAPDEKDFPTYLQFLEFGEAGLCAIGNALVATNFGAPEDQRKNWTSAYIVDAQRKRLGIVEKHLGDGREYMAAGRFTAADISVGYAIGVFKLLGLIRRTTPAIESYFERVTARPAYRKAAGPAVAA